MLKVKEIPKNERPYERLINYGKEFLSTDELLAILIKSGYKDSSSKIIATRIISGLKNLSDLKKMRYEDLIKIIKTTYLRNKERIDNNKKIGGTDDEYFKQAEKYLYNEFSFPPKLFYYKNN